jgi:hypothetical protein
MLVVLLTARGAMSKPAVREPAAVQVLFRYERFEGLVGLTANRVTPGSQAFVRLYRSRDTDGFRVLARARSASANLYGLCGLEHLGSRDAAALRERLLKSNARTSIDFGDELGSELPLSELLAVTYDGTRTRFDEVCADLVDYAKREGQRRRR